MSYKFTVYIDHFGDKEDFKDFDKFLEEFDIEDSGYPYDTECDIDKFFRLLKAVPNLMCIHIEERSGKDCVVLHSYYDM